jgi:hypothetical protein
MKWQIMLFLIIFSLFKLTISVSRNTQIIIQHQIIREKEYIIENNDEQSSRFYSIGEDKEKIRVEIYIDQEKHPTLAFDLGFQGKFTSRYYNLIFDATMCYYINDENGDEWMECYIFMQAENIWKIKFIFPGAKNGLLYNKSKIDFEETIIKNLIKRREKLISFVKDKSTVAILNEKFFNLSKEEKKDFEYDYIAKIFFSLSFDGEDFLKLKENYFRLMKRINNNRFKFQDIFVTKVSELISSQTEKQAKLYQKLEKYLNSQAETIKRKFTKETGKTEYRCFTKLTNSINNGWKERPGQTSQASFLNNLDKALYSFALADRLSESLRPVNKLYELIYQILTQPDNIYNFDVWKLRKKNNLAIANENMKRDINYNIYITELETEYKTHIETLKG